MSQQLMVHSLSGQSGDSAQKHVEMEPKIEHVPAPTQHQVMEGKTVVE